MLTILEEEWQKGINPDVYRLRCDLGIRDLESDKQFYSALEQLVENKEILLEWSQNGFYVIVPYHYSS